MRIKSLCTGVVVLLPFFHSTKCCFRWLRGNISVSDSQVNTYVNKKKAAYSVGGVSTLDLSGVESCVVAAHVKVPVGNTLMLAVERGYMHLIKELLANGADVNYREAGYTPLCTACSCRNYEAVQYLLAAGAAPNLTGYVGWTPLMIAAQQGATAAVFLLWRSGAWVNHTSDIDRVSALYLACQAGHEDCVQFLIYAGANINHVIRENITPLLTAIHNEHSAVASLLLDAGADVSIRSEQQWTPLWLASRHGLVDVVSKLLRAGADPEAIGPHGSSALNIAACQGRRDIVELLLNAGADTEHCGSDKATVLYCALKGGNADLARLLVEHGADTDALWRRKGVLDLLPEADFTAQRKFIIKALYRGFSRHNQEQLAVFDIDAKQAIEAKNNLHQAMSAFCFEGNDQHYFPRDLHFLIGSFVGGVLAQRDTLFEELG